MIETKKAIAAKDYLRIDYEAREGSYLESYRVKEYYHNRQYTNQQLLEFKKDGLKPETYNLIKLYERVLRGYFSSIVSSIKAKAGNNSSPTLGIAFDAQLQKILEENDFDVLGDTIKQNILLYGFLCLHYSIEDSGKKNKLGEPILNIKFSILNSDSVIVDHMAVEKDFNDATRVSHWKWISELEFKKLFGVKKFNDLNNGFRTDTDFANAYFKSDVFGTSFSSNYKTENKFLIVNTVVQTDKGYTSYHWCGDNLLKIDHLDFNPYRCFRLYEDTDNNEDYGVMREIMEIQDSVNTHIMNIKRFDNDERLFVDVNKLDMSDEFPSVAEAKAEFTRMYNSVNEVIFMGGISNSFQSEKFSKDIAEEFQKLSEALTRARDILGITPSFLGDAAASDSGRKVKYQQQASANSFRYLDTTFKYIFKTIGDDLKYLIKKYKHAHDLIRLTDKYGKDTWTEVNAPFIMPINSSDGTKYKVMKRELLDKEGRVLLDENGAIKMRIVREPDQDLALADIDIQVTSYNYLEREEMERVMTETIIQGVPGQMLAQANPASYFHLLALNVRSMESKHSVEFAEVFENTAKQLGFVDVRDPRDVAAQTGPGGQPDRANGGAQLANAMGKQTDLGTTN